MQFSIHKHNPTATDLHLFGLSDILKTIGSFETNARVYFLGAFFDFVPTLENHKALNGWIIELIGYIQSDLAEAQTALMKEVSLLLDVFLIAVISLSGYGALFGKRTIVEDLGKRLSVFPPSLIMIFQMNMWRDIENKVRYALNKQHESHTPLNVSIICRYMNFSTTCTTTRTFRHHMRNVSKTLFCAARSSHIFSNRRRGRNSFRYEDCKYKSIILFSSLLNRKYDCFNYR